MSRNQNTEIMDMSLYDHEQYIDTELANGYSSHPSFLRIGERLASLTAGGFFLYRAIKSFKRQPLRSISLGLSGSYLLYKGVSGKNPVYNHAEQDGDENLPLTIETSLEVNSPREEVYAFWRKLENLPLFMKHLKSVHELDARRSVWEVKVPGNLADLTWEATISKEDKNQFLSWKSVDDAIVENSGRVSFKDLPHKTGTRIDVFISYRLAAGSFGSGVAKLFNPLFKKIIESDVKNFTDYMDAHSIR